MSSASPQSSSGISSPLLPLPPYPIPPSLQLYFPLPPASHELENRAQQCGQDGLQWLQVLHLLHKVADGHHGVHAHGELGVGQTGHGLRGRERGGREGSVTTESTRTGSSGSERQDTACGEGGVMREGGGRGGSIAPAECGGAPAPRDWRGTKRPAQAGGEAGEGEGDVTPAGRGQDRYDTA